MKLGDLVEAIENGIGLPKGLRWNDMNRVNRIREFSIPMKGSYSSLMRQTSSSTSTHRRRWRYSVVSLTSRMVGIVIAGEPRLETELKGNFARFANRMDFYYKLKGLSKNEGS